MRDAEEAAFARGIEVETLMDEAGVGIARAVRKFFPHPGTCFVYAGKGHNGGDALVAAEHLKRAGWKIDIHLALAPIDFFANRSVQLLAKLINCATRATLLFLRSIFPPVWTPIPAKSIRRIASLPISRSQSV